VVFAFIFNMGLGTSHSMVPYNLFHYRLGFSIKDWGMIAALHRFTLGVPQLVASWLIARVRNRKALFMTVVTLEGLCLAAAGLIVEPMIAVVVWLMHDLVGASVWGPIQNQYVQYYARAESRATQVAKFMTLSRTGMVLGSALAGILMGRAAGLIGIAPADSSALPTVLGGLLMIVSVAVLAFVAAPGDERRTSFE
jgi:sugar phosphate permease